MESTPPPPGCEMGSKDPAFLGLSAMEHEKHLFFYVDDAVCLKNTTFRPFFLDTGAWWVIGMLLNFLIITTDRFVPVFLLV